MLWSSLYQIQVLPPNFFSEMTVQLLSLRFYATGSFLTVTGDFCGVHKSTASKTVKKVSM
jgi:hypothetical protein